MVTSVEKNTREGYSGEGSGGLAEHVVSAIGRSWFRLANVWLTASVLRDADLAADGAGAT
jgi:hypothetical protein